MRSRTAKRGPPVARDHGEDGPVDAPAVAPAEPEIAEVRIVEAHREAPEVVIPGPHEALVGGEAAPGEVAVAEPRVDRLGRVQPALHRQQHAGREDRIEERRGVPHGHPPVAGQDGPEIRVVRVEAGGRDALGGGHEPRRARRVLDVVREALLGRRARFAPVDRLGDHRAHAHHGLRDRDEPEPAHVGPGEHPDVARPSARGARHPLVLGMHGDVAEQGVHVVAPELLGEEARPPGRVDHHAHAHRVLGALRIGEAERDPPGLEGRLQRPVALADGHPGLLGVAEEELVEGLARHLEGLGRRRLRGFREIGVLLRGAVDRPEARAPLPDEPGPRDRVLDAQGLEDLVGPGKLGLADVEARELLPLQEEDPAPPARERRGRAGAARPAADDGGVEVPGVRRAHARRGGGASASRPAIDCSYSHEPMLPSAKMPRSAIHWTVRSKTSFV